MFVSLFPWRFPPVSPCWYLSGFCSLCVFIDLYSAFTASLSLVFVSFSFCFLDPASRVLSAFESSPCFPCNYYNFISNVHLIRMFLTWTYSKFAEGGWWWLNWEWSNRIMNLCSYMNVTLPRHFGEKRKLITARCLTPLASQFAVLMQVRPDWYNIYSADFELTYCPHLETNLNGVRRTDEELGVRGIIAKWRSVSVKNRWACAGVSAVCWLWWKFIQGNGKKRVKCLVGVSMFGQ